jgi:hypothetical protein
MAVYTRTDCQTWALGRLFFVGVQSCGTIRPLLLVAAGSRVDMATVFEPQFNTTTPQPLLVRPAQAGCSGNAQSPRRGEIYDFVPALSDMSGL